MDRDRLYLRLMDELSKTADQPEDDFQLLMASAHLRKLLLDDSPLVHQVNRTRRVKIIFSPAAEPAHPWLGTAEGPTFWAQLDGLSPRMSARGSSVPTVPSKLDAFLGTRVAWIAGHEVTVKDAILQLAHVSGGVHFGVPKTEIQRRMAEASEMIQVGGANVMARTMRGVSAVVVDGLQPLTATVRAEVYAGGA